MLPFMTQGYIMRRFTSNMKGLITFVLIALISFTAGRIRKHRPSHPMSVMHAAQETALVPDPSATVPGLNNVVQSITSWQPTNSSATSWNTSYPPTPFSSGYNSIPATDGLSTDDLTASLQGIQAQSNSDISKLTGSMSSSNMLVDLVRLNLSRLEMAVRKNISRIDSVLNDIGAQSTGGASGSLENVQTQLANLENQVGQLQSGTSTAGNATSLSQRISDLGTSLASLDKRVGVLESEFSSASSLYYTDSSDAALADESTTSSDSSVEETTSIQFVLTSWVGRTALLALFLAIIGLSLTTHALSKLPKQPVTEDEAKPEDEQVLMEAGEGEAAEEPQEEQEQAEEVPAQ